MTSKPATTEPLPRRPVSLLASIRFSVRAWLLRHLSRLGMAYLKRRDKPRWAAAAPTLIKTYAARPTLRNRIHIPPSHRPGDVHPLFVLIHGGGWTLGDPSMDDEQAHLLARRGGFVVACLDYRLGPAHRFPTAIHDVAALARSVLADSISAGGELPIDAAAGLVVGGFSAGAVMALTLAQQLLRDHVRAVVAFQPLTDWTGAARGASRTTTPWGTADDLQHNLGLFEWAYVPAGQNLRDPLLSPLFATRARLPQPVFVVAGGADCLRDEQSLLARRLAGRDEVGDPAESWDDAEARVRYECAPDMPHCFTHFWVRPRGEVWRRRQREAIDDVWGKVLGWLDVVS